MVMSFSILHLVIVVLIGVCIWLAVKWLVKKDTEVENRRRMAIDLVATLKEMGFKGDLVEFYLDYAVGDYSGIAWKVAALARKFAGGKQAVLAELEDVFKRLLEIKLQTADGRLLVQAKLDEIKVEE